MSAGLWLVAASKPTTTTPDLGKVIRDSFHPLPHLLVGLWPLWAILGVIGAVKAHPLGPPGTPGTTALSLIALNPVTASWASFPGRWSEGQLLWLGTTPRRFTSLSQGDGPATPHWNSTSIPSLWHVESS